MAPHTRLVHRSERTMITGQGEALVLETSKQARQTDEQVLKHIGRITKQKHKAGDEAGTGRRQEHKQVNRSSQANLSPSFFDAIPTLFIVLHKPSLTSFCPYCENTKTLSPSGGDKTSPPRGGDHNSSPLSFSLTTSVPHLGPQVRFLTLNHN